MCPQTLLNYFYCKETLAQLFLRHFEKLKQNIIKTFVIPTENIRKPEVFWCFQSDVLSGYGKSCHFEVIQSSMKKVRIGFGSKQVLSLSNFILQSNVLFTFKK